LPDLDVVTGATGYLGRHIAERLLSAGRRVRTLTGHPGRPSPLRDRVEVAPYRFDDVEALAETLRGARTLYITYWVRFPRGGVTHEGAVENSRRLVTAAVHAGVRRIVHVSITNPSAASDLSYFSGKALVEEAVRGSGLSHAILRPTVMFGGQDILVNNIAWLLRRLPVFAIPGTGGYRLQPVLVDDVADLAVRHGDGAGCLTVDAMGPEVHTFDGMVRLVARSVRSRARLVHVPPAVALPLLRILGAAVGDVVLTAAELRGLMDGLLVSEAPPTCPTALSSWLREHGESLGRTYASEVARHYR
jgi:uncharacterized protein YbjT (DUF2867 family)